MRQYRVRQIDGARRLVLEEAAQRQAAPGEVVVRVRATALNYRDLIVLQGGYPRNDTPDVVPLSDGAGEIVEVGSGVQGWAAGDRVAIGFFRDWSAGEADEHALGSGHGGGVDGLLADYVAVPAHALVRISDSLGFEAAATLPCAGVTAWHGLIRCGVRPGSTVLLLGTGGVSIFALQFAKAMGARVIITSSSDDKLARAKALGADLTVNYQARPDWDVAVRELTDGRGVDVVLDVGGPGTLGQSLAATRPGGQVALIGVMVGEPQPQLAPIILNALTVHGIYVGPTAMLRDAVAAIAANGIAPVIDRSFAFNEAEAAYDHLRSQQHLGKVVIRHDP